MKRANGGILVGLMLAGLVLMLGGCATENVSGKDTLALVRDADLAYSQGNWSRAESQYRLIVQRVPGDAYAWFKLGNLYLHTDRPNEAMYAYQQTLARDSSNTKAYHNLALLYLLQSQRTLQAGIKAAAPNDPQLPASRKLLAQLTTLAASDISDQRISLKANNRAAPGPTAPTTLVPTTLPLTPAHTPPPVAVPPVTVGPIPPAPAEPDPVIIDVDSAGQSHRRMPAAFPTHRQDASSAADAPMPEEQVDAGRTRLTVLSRSLFMREAPNPTAAPVMGLNRGDIVIAVNTGTESGWRRVRRDGITGWVYARYLREIAPAGSTQTSPSSGRNP